MPRHLRIRFLLAAAVVVIASSVFLAADSQRSAADRAFGEIEASQAMLTAMLDQETGLRGYAQTARNDFLEPFVSGKRSFENALVEAKAAIDSADSEEGRDLRAAEVAARRWQASAEGAVAEIQARGRPGVPIADVRARKVRFDAFRTANRAHQQRLRSDRRESQRKAGLVSVGLILALGVLFGSLGFFLIERPARAAAGRRERRLHFTEAMQVARTEIEAHDVVKRHLERALPRTRTAVLRRNNSANRLEPATVLDDASPLLTTLDGAAPDACMAIRLGKTYQRGANAEALLACEICGAISSDSTCVPSLVGGEVIGSVLVEHEGALGEHQRDEVSAAVNDAAPVIANLHNLARAELRAATDALTGLPNNRAIQETIKRMVAQATRSSTPMSAVIFDLDHFKQVNDTFGHAAGDEVLAAVGVLAASTVRESDFVGRYGGEEFVMLLPETAVDGAVLAADKLRRAISTIKVPGVDRHLTASFGVATLPDDADDAALLLRAADRALYAAKKAGRDRVETVEALAEVDGAPAA